MDAFDILGIDPNSSVAFAKVAYRRLASMHHPDKGGDTTRFQAIQTAWDAIERGYRRPVQQQPKKPSEGRPYGPGEWFDAYEKALHAKANPQQQRAKNVYGNGGKFGDVYKDFRQGTTGALEIDVPITDFDRPYIFSVSGTEYRVPNGVPHGWIGYVDPINDSRQNLSGARSILICVNLYAPHDRAMAIAGVEGPRTAFTNNVGDCVTIINTNAINLIVGAWVDVQDAFGKVCRVRIPSGFEPTRRLRVSGGGYYGYNEDSQKPVRTRGDLILQVDPTFTTLDKIPAEDFYNAMAVIDERKKS